MSYRQNKHVHCSLMMLVFKSHALGRFSHFFHIRDFRRIKVQFGAQNLDTELRWCSLLLVRGYSLQKESQALKLTETRLFQLLSHSGFAP